MLRRLLILSACLCTLFLGIAQAENRLALVIEQGDYQGNLNDIDAAPKEAALIAASLQNSGFVVERAANMTRQNLQSTLAAFRSGVKAAGAEQTVVFLYYTGHGASDPRSKESYLLATDAKIDTLDDLDKEGLRISLIRDSFDTLGAKAVILVFDACRDEGALASIPPGTKGLSRNDPGAPGVDARGLEVVEAQNDMLIAYSTGVGDTASEGGFAPSLADAMSRPYQNLVSVFAWTQRRVAQRTNGDQRPWANNLLYGEEICLVSCAPDYLVVAGENLGLSAVQTKAILASFGYTDIPIEMWSEALADSAKRLKELEAELASVDDDSPEIAKLISSAREAVELADFAYADELLREAAELDIVAGELRLRRASETIEHRAEVAWTEGRFIDAAARYREAANYMRPFDEMEWARLKYQQGLSLYMQGQYSLDTALLWRAIGANQEALKAFTRERAPLEWADTQDNLGNAFAALGDRGNDDALEQAAIAYKKALEERTRDHVPLKWAATQNNLGAVLAVLGERGDDAALEQAISAFRASLEEVSRESSPLDWARTQDNLGNALLTLGERRDYVALEQAIVAFRKALEERTKDRVPLDWAGTQSNLGNALVLLGERGDELALEQAIGGFRDVLTEFTRERSPLDWAMTQNNLGNALATLGEQGNDDALNQALVAYRAALEVYTRERSPLDWAMTQNNLAIVFASLGATGDDAFLEKAEIAYREALEVYTRERSPLDWAMTQNNLGTVLTTMGEYGDEAAAKRAVAAYRLALQERTRERMPLDWARTQNNLGAALVVLGKQGDDASLEMAIVAYRNALEERTRERVPLSWAATQLNLGEALLVLGKRGDEAAIHQAADAYGKALEVFTQEANPEQYELARSGLLIAQESLNRTGDVR
jgi:tetratricopeptide (TPR) repeat protein